MSLGARFQNVPLLETKFHIPPVRPERVPRPRLIERLNAGLGQGSGLGRNHGFACKLTLVSAPAGFGKTTLLSDWLRKIELPVAWLSLDDSDNDLARFLGARIGQHDSSRGDRLSAGGILELEP